MFFTWEDDSLAEGRMEYWQRFSLIDYSGLDMMANITWQFLLCLIQCNVMTVTSRVSWLDRSTGRNKIGYVLEETFSEKSWLAFGQSLKDKGLIDENFKFNDLTLFPPPPP